MRLSFNEEIQSGYYQNTSVSVEGASLEWVDEGGAKHTRYFGLYEQPQYSANDGCVLWRSYKGANDWKMSDGG
jgi:hypothetical protein